MGTLQNARSQAEKLLLAWLTSEPGSGAPSADGLVGVWGGQLGASIDQPEFWQHAGALAKAVAEGRIPDSPGNRRLAAQIHMHLVDCDQAQQQQSVLPEPSPIIAQQIAARTGVKLGGDAPAAPAPAADPAVPLSLAQQIAAQKATVKPAAEARPAEAAAKPAEPAPAPAAGAPLSLAQQIAVQKAAAKPAPAEKPATQPVPAAEAAPAPEPAPAAPAAPPGPPMSLAKQLAAKMAAAKAAAPAAPEASTTALAESAAQTPESAPAAELAKAEVLPFSAATTPPPTEPELPPCEIGPLKVDPNKFNGFLQEADALVLRLTNDVAEWRHELKPPTVRIKPSRMAMESAADLYYQSADIGFEPLTRLAGALQMALEAMAHPMLPREEAAVFENNPPKPAELNNLTSVIECQRALLHQFAAGAWPKTDSAYRKAIVSCENLAKSRGAY
ncbi:MAG: hypothetical protein MO853_01930 [Candidatus Protistobacter heckmanni]|nr:hypothetical protein [Candidatus Protistobacter heckmanni]